MADVAVEVVRVRGTCNAGLCEGDTFILRGLRIIPQGPIAFASVVMNAGRLTLGSSPVCIACPDPGTGEGGNVVLKLIWRQNREDHPY